MNFYCVCIAQLSDGIYRMPSLGICYIDWSLDIGHWSRKTSKHLCIRLFLNPEIKVKIVYFMAFHQIKIIELY